MNIARVRCVVVVVSSAFPTTRFTRVFGCARVLAFVVVCRIRPKPHTHAKRAVNLCVCVFGVLLFYACCVELLPNKLKRIPRTTADENWIFCAGEFVTFRLHPSPRHPSTMASIISTWASALSPQFMTVIFAKPQHLLATSPPPAGQ